MSSPAAPSDPIDGTKIVYKRDVPLTHAQLVDLYHSAPLPGRPEDDFEAIYANSNLVFSAWGRRFVGGGGPIVDGFWICLLYFGFRGEEGVPECRCREGTPAADQRSGGELPGCLSDVTARGHGVLSESGLCQDSEWIHREKGTICRFAVKTFLPLLFHWNFSRAQRHFFYYESVRWLELLLSPFWIETLFFNPEKEELE